MEKEMLQTVLSRQRQVKLHAGVNRWSAWAGKLRHQYDAGAGSIIKPRMEHVRYCFLANPIYQRWTQHSKGTLVGIHLHFNPILGQNVTRGMQQNLIPQPSANEAINQRNLTPRPSANEAVNQRSLEQPSGVLIPAVHTVTVGKPSAFKNLAGTRLVKRFETLTEATIKRVRQLSVKQQLNEELTTLKKIVVLRTGPSISDPVGATPQTSTESAPKANLSTAPGQAAFPAVNIDQLASEVLRKLDGRIRAYKERMGSLF